MKYACIEERYIREVMHILVSYVAQENAEK